MMLAQHGGLAGVRDEAALAKPSNLFAYRKPELTEMAASYAVGIVKNRPFLDGNKRTGCMLAATFLELNGMKFTATEASVVKMTLGLASGKAKERVHGEWLEENSVEG